MKLFSVIGLIVNVGVVIVGMLSCGSVNLFSVIGLMVNFGVVNC